MLSNEINIKDGRLVPSNVKLTNDVHGVEDDKKEDIESMKHTIEIQHRNYLKALKEGNERDAETAKNMVWELYEKIKKLESSKDSDTNDVQDSITCKAKDIGFGGKGYKCKNCGATDAIAGKIRHKIIAKDTDLVEGLKAAIEINKDKPELLKKLKEELELTLKQVNEINKQIETGDDAVLGQTEVGWDSKTKDAEWSKNGYTIEKQIYKSREGKVAEKYDIFDPKGRDMATMLDLASAIKAAEEYIEFDKIYGYRSKDSKTKEEDEAKYRVYYMVRGEDRNIVRQVIESGLTKEKADSIARKWKIINHIDAKVETMDSKTKDHLQTGEKVFATETAFGLEKDKSYIIKNIEQIEDDMLYTVEAENGDVFDVLGSCLLRQKQVGDDSATNAMLGIEDEENMTYAELLKAYQETHNERFLERAKKLKAEGKDSEEDTFTEDPLTEKGKEIMKAMKEKYGEKKGEEVFYASRNKGTISGVDPES